MVGRRIANHRHGPHIPMALQAEVQRRLAKVEGQVKGLQRMVEEDRYCVDLLMQVDAARGALRQVGRLILRNYVERCVTRAMLDGDSAIYDEVMEVINRYQKE
ncbi:MAG: metal-sensitive transcriptional regulator [Bacillota bacterium]